MLEQERNLFILRQGSDPEINRVFGLGFDFGFSGSNPCAKPFKCYFCHDSYKLKNIIIINEKKMKNYGL